MELRLTRTISKHEELLGTNISTCKKFEFIQTLRDFSGLKCMADFLDETLDPTEAYESFILAD